MIHVLRTRSPVYSPLRAFSLDLHVLGTPPAFVLSQDQTLQLNVLERQLLALTYFNFTQSIAVSAICFVDLLSGFQRPSVTAPLRTTNCPPPPLLAGPRLLPLSAAACHGPRFRPRARHQS